MVVDSQLKARLLHVRRDSVVFASELLTWSSIINRRLSQWTQLSAACAASREPPTPNNSDLRFWLVLVLKIEVDEIPESRGSLVILSKGSIANQLSMNP